MAPKGGNAKKESGRAKKAENEAKKKQAAEEEKERKESAKWETGAKGKAAKEEKEAKRKEALAAKAEREKLLAEEEASASAKPKPTPKAGAKKKAAAAGASAKPAGPGALAAGGGLAAVPLSPKESVDDGKGGQEEAESFAATGIDDAIAMMEVVTAKKDKASMGQQAAGLEKHPERRFKAAFEAYQERELPTLRQDHPGLRLNQYRELLYKQFQKSPDNPFNQTIVAYDASKDERLEALDRRNKEIEERLKDRTKDLSLDD
ncbi:DUF1014-domain-containing protein [Fomitiporia mediterranea MF3/22]|uniref:DUF1014-domain-containing protein n=1 Tax=Fomitiporia mediterranea (strain MF3/22) TaxID=694068 RepID=R7SH06_FOMME|nr:DUF1014-domain-containing protein [Fomitiporia mediterranea MF3/22]EJC97582.1 DUF1014-domain-containing protein [Fomitiporia mediterranea MF3/22]